MGTVKRTVPPGMRMLTTRSWGMAFPSMLLRADKTKPPIPFIPFNAPVGDWEKRYAEFSHVNDLADVTAFRLGANPRGTQCTFWIRNLEILRRK